MPIAGVYAAYGSNAAGYIGSEDGNSSASAPVSLSANSGDLPGAQPLRRQAQTAGSATPRKYSSW
jgi:hypothetical protein